MSSSKTSGPHSKRSAKETLRLSYVSRGGIKLRGALDHFNISAQDRICMDVGCSTGGFTDCLLQAGAKSVWAVDVGYGLLDYKFRRDPRVHMLERTNFRYFDAKQLTESPTLISVDVSFISVSHILPKVDECLGADGQVLLLVKPQFEGTPKEVPGGFVKDEPTRQAILERAKHIVEGTGFVVRGISDAVLAGRKGNQEAFFYLQK